MQGFMQKAEYQNSPMRILTDFIKNEITLYKAEEAEKMRFVGYVLDIGYDEVRIITSDPYKRAVGGIPRGSYLIMCPKSFKDIPPHFTLLRVNGVATTPLNQETQQTYFELHKKSMPELDVWTQSELQWGALSTTVLGMFYADPSDPNKLSFSGDVNNIVSPHHYSIFAPNDELLDLIVNGIVKESNQFSLGQLRLTECQLPFHDVPTCDVDVKVSTDDFKGFRTAMFGKTRLGKSNVVKLLAQSMIETTEDDRSVGQLIFDVNGEYANDNPQDGNLSLRSAYADRCVVYALTPRKETPSKPLKLNFYEQPDSTIEIISRLLEQENQSSQYIKSFASVVLPNISEIQSMEDRSQKTRSIRKVQIYWAILSKAGFEANEKSLRELGLRSGSKHGPSHFDPHFNADFLKAVYGGVEYTEPTNLDSLQSHLEKISSFVKENEGSDLLKSKGKDIFDADDKALLKFFNPGVGSGGPVVLRPFKQYHDKNASHFIKEIKEELDNGQTIILDLGNANDNIRRYFSDLVSKAVFSMQENKFVTNQLENKFIQLYFEEAHNLFPKDSNDTTSTYARFAKEGAKFHIGIVYSTQSPSTISKELLVQTENFFVGHISSIDELNSLSRLQILYDGLQKDITSSRKPGYMRMLTFSHRFVVPVQAKLFEAIKS
jgi:DNA helicase HerA-like ATPase